MTAAAIPVSYWLYNLVLILVLRSLPHIPCLTMSETVVKEVKLLARLYRLTHIFESTKIEILQISKDGLSMFDFLVCHVA